MWIEELREEMRKLDLLLADPHPGLMTWQDMLRTRLTRINNLTTLLLGVAE